MLGIANKRLAHQRDRYGLGHDDAPGPIGVAVAVVRGREMYVATVGPAEAYLIRQARLSTLPDPNKERGLPATDLEPEVWRGELQVGDSLCLVSANVVARVGTDALKDALVTLHPQSAIEHLHARFAAADGRGSDGAVAFEASEVGSTHKARTLVPVRPARAARRRPRPRADPAGGLRGGRRGRGGGQRREGPRRGRQRLPALRVAPPGPPAPPAPGQAQGHHRDQPTGDAAPGRRRPARVHRRRRAASPSASTRSRGQQSPTQPLTDRSPSPRRRSARPRRPSTR